MIGLNVCSTINYYNTRLIKGNIYEAEANENYFRLVTLKIVHVNDIEFHSYDIAGTLDNVLAGSHCFVKSGQRIIVFQVHISLEYWIQQHQFVIGHRLKQELISILRYFSNKYFIYFLTFFYFIYFYLANISYPVTCFKLFNTLCHQRSCKMDLVRIM